jgi:hypothetical protein
MQHRIHEKSGGLLRLRVMNTVVFAWFALFKFNFFNPSIRPGKIRPDGHEPDTYNIRFRTGTGIIGGSSE